MIKIYYNDTSIEIQPDDNAYVNVAVKSIDTLELTFEYPGFLDIPVGAYCTFEGTTYYLLKPENFVKNGTRKYAYTITMQSDGGRLGLYKLRNTVDGRLKFDMMAKPQEYLKMIVDNINKRNAGWTVGNCITASEKMISFNHNYLDEVLDTLAETFETEWYIRGKEIHLGKVQFNSTDPLELSYGKGNGFLPGLGRSNYDNSLAFDILFVQGGERNIDYSTYGNKTLLLPKNQTIRFDGQHFEGEANFSIANSRQYVTDAEGLSIRRNDKMQSALAPEDSFDTTESYPKRVGKVSEWVTVDAEKNFYDFKDSSIPLALNYNECQITGEMMTVQFQTGMLAGKEFDIDENGYDHDTRTFKIVPQEIDGQIMPNDIFKAQAGDEYIIFGCTLPPAYICDNDSKTGASWDMFKEAVRYMYENEDARFTFDGVLDGKWAAERWNVVSPKLTLGGLVSFSDTQFLTTPEKIRIIGIKTYLNKPHYPELTLSNSSVSSSIVTELNEYKAEEVVREKRHAEAVQFSKRRWRDLKETAEMLESALTNYSSAINPVSVETMQLIAGDESLQFRFVTNKIAPVADGNFSISFDGTSKVLRISGGLTGGAAILQHMTIGISGLSSQRKASEYKFWDIPQFKSDQLTDASKKYYVYAKVSKINESGSFMLSETAIGMDDVTGYYHLLVGLLNSEFENTRSFAQMFGYTEILPGRVTTDRVVSQDGINYFDLVTGYLNMSTADGAEFIRFGENGVEISGKVTIGKGSTGLKDFGEYKELETEIKNRTPYTILLSNQNCSVACDVDGNVVGTLPRTQVQVYYGATLQSGWAVALKCVGCDASYTNGVVALTSLTADNATVEVTASKDDCPTLIIAMTISKVRAGQTGESGNTPEIKADGYWYIGGVNTGIKAEGADGDDGQTPEIGTNGNWWIGGTDTGKKAQGVDGAAAVIYFIEPSVSVVKRTWKGGLVPELVTCKAFKVVGNDPAVESSARTLTYQLSDGAETAYNGAISVGKNTEYIDFKLKDGDVVIDSQRVLVLNDASELDIDSIENAISDLQAQSQSTNRILEDMNNDRVLDAVEKSYIRTLWENINGVPSLVTVGSTGSYISTLEMVEKAEYASGQDVMLTFNGKALTFNGKTLVFNHLGLEDFKVSYLNLRQYLSELSLYDNSMTEGYDRQKMSSLFTAYYDAQEKLLENAQYHYADMSAKDTLNQFIQGDYADEIAGLKASLDEKAETFVQGTDPAASWNTNEVKAKHVSDMWWNSSDKDVSGVKAGATAIYRFDGSKYYWEESPVPKAIFDEIDGKNAIYVSKPTNYKARDMWIMEEGLTAGDVPADCKPGEMLIATTSSATYSAAHWKKYVRYTDDSALQTFIKGDYANMVKELQGQIDGKAQSFVQSSDPASEWLTAEVKKSHVGDMWLNTSSTAISGIGSMKTAIYQLVNNAYKWVQKNIPNEMFDQIDGKASLFVTKPTSYHENDMWIIGNDIAASDMPTGASVGELMVSTADSGSFNKAHWVKKVKYTDDKALEEFLEGAYKETVDNLQQQIQSTTEAINKMNSDHVLNESEKSYIRTEWEKISGYPHFDKVGTSGSYQTTLDIIAASGYTVGGAVNLTFNGKKLIFNGKSLSFNYRGMDSFRSAFYNLRDYLDEMDLYSVGSTEGFDREKLARLFAAYYDAQAILIDNSQKYYASKKAEDANIIALDEIAHKIGYADYAEMVKEAEENGNTIIENGHIRTNLIDTENLVTKRMFTKDGKVQILEDGRIQAEQGVFNEGEFNDVKVKGSLCSPFVLWRSYDIKHSGNGKVYHRYPAGDTNGRYAWANYSDSGVVSYCYTAVEEPFNGQAVYETSTGSQSAVALECKPVNVFDGNEADSVKHDNVVLPKTTASSSTSESNKDGYEIGSDDFSWGPENSGRVIRLANYKWGGTIAYGRTFLKAPSGKYFYENGRQHSQLMISRECVVLLGYGTEKVFYGWIVLNRQNILTVGYYGMPLNVLFQGIFIPQSPYLEKLWSAELMTTGLSENWTIKILDSTGKYRIYLPMYFSDVSNFHVMLTPQLVTVSGGAITSVPNNLYACLCGKGNEYSTEQGKTLTYFDVVIADDDSWNVGGFLFQIISTSDWISPTQQAAAAASYAMVKSSAEDDIQEDGNVVKPEVSVMVLSNNE